MDKKRSQFKTLTLMKKIAEKNLIFLDNLNKLLKGEITEAIIGILPDNEGFLFIDAFKIINIIDKHGELPKENMIITATEPTSAIKQTINGRPSITLIYEHKDKSFVLSSRKYNGHYVVTFFEPSNSKYIRSVKKRGEIIL